MLLLMGSSLLLWHVTLFACGHLEQAQQAAMSQSEHKKQKYTKRNNAKKHTHTGPIYMEGTPLGGMSAIRTVDIVTSSIICC